MNIRFIASLFALCTIPAFAVPWLGVTFKKTTFENHLALDVKGVHPGSGCFTAGVVAGDKIPLRLVAPRFVIADHHQRDGG